MKQRTKQNGSKNDDWATPEFILNWVRYFYGEFFDPCPLKADFDGLDVDWGIVNFINPPYNIKDKPLFIKKAIEEADKGCTCILLIPVTTETESFRLLWQRADEIFFIHKRVKFKGFNTKGEYVTDKTGQSGSMLVVLRPKERMTSPAVELIYQRDMELCTK